MTPRRLVLAAWLLALLHTSALASESIEWDRAFRTTTAPTQVHFRARYMDALGALHRLEVWRDADRRLRRRTDDRLDLYVERAADGEYRYWLVDHARAIVLSGDRTSLYRIGSFSDWAGLAHVLSPPRNRYLVRRSLRAAEATPHGPCLWYDLEVASHVPHRVCWSEALGLPFMIETMAGASQFRIEELDSQDISSGVFSLSSNGYLRIDADRDGKLDD
jgi:hypothetical protein